jgi:hypothetical protein
VPLPLPRLPARSRRLGFSGALALLLTIAAARAHALELTLESPWENSSRVWIGAQLSDLFEERVVQSLSRGMPATLELHAELWRKRSGWFDRLESSYDAAVRIRYEVWNDWYVVERPGAAPLIIGTLDSVSLIVSRPMALPVGRISAMQPDARYYVTVTATLKPLSVEDVEEVEGWLSGEVETKRRAGFGVITELPRSVFDAVRNFAGFGDHRAREQTPQFTPDELAPESAAHGSPRAP